MNAAAPEKKILTVHVSKGTLTIIPLVLKHVEEALVLFWEDMAFQAD